MPEMTMVIERVTPSLNETMRRNPFVLKRYWRGANGWGGWLGAVLAALPRRYQRPPSNAHVTVEIVRYGARELDHDNLVGGCKGLVDILTSVGLIGDDSPQWTTIRYEQHSPTPARDRRTEIRLRWSEEAGR